MRFSYLFNIVKKAKSKGANIIHVNTDPEYKWHKYSEKWTIDLKVKLVKKKHPEQLVTVLWEMIP